MRRPFVFEIISFFTIMTIHFIAIGGALMHNLALALYHKGYAITGSDDAIYDPSRTRLAEAGLLPEAMGWHPERLHAGIDAVIVGMHARPNNPELLQAQALGLTIYSYPEYLYLQSKDKIRVVVGGSHGKTTTTAMIMHMLRYHGVDFDYAVGAQLEGFDRMVRLSDAPLIVLEGDEYLSSPLDPSPKFLHYRPHIAVLTGIAWDHINVFPSFKKYRKQFKRFVRSLMPQSTLIYFKKDPLLEEYAAEAPDQTIGYHTPPYQVVAHQTQWLLPQVTHLPEAQRAVPLQIFGEHNLQNLQAARLVGRELGWSDVQIAEAMQEFKGAARRLQVLQTTEHQAIFQDFAHAPSKVQATAKALKQQYPDRPLVAALELHTFSSLNADFIEQYKGSLGSADKAYVFFDPATLKAKRLPELSEEAVQAAFFHPNLTVYTDPAALWQQLQQHVAAQRANLLLMSSGNWGGQSLETLLETSSILSSFSKK